MRTRLLLAAIGLMLSTGGSAATTPDVRTINLYSHGYDPASIKLTPGREVTLKFVNTSGKGHDFTAKKFFRTSRILSGSAPEGEVELGAGETRTITLVPAAGRYKVHCGKPFHKTLGMRAEIIVR